MRALPFTYWILLGAVTGAVAALIVLLGRPGALWQWLIIGAVTLGAAIDQAARDSRELEHGRAPE